MYISGDSQRDMTPTLFDGSTFLGVMHNTGTCDGVMLTCFHANDGTDAATCSYTCSGDDYYATLTRAAAPNVEVLSVFGSSVSNGYATSPPLPTLLANVPPYY